MRCREVPPELKHVRDADAAAQHGSFRGAADALGLKQSNLSRRIAEHLTFRQRSRGIGPRCQSARRLTAWAPGFCPAPQFAIPRLRATRASFSASAS
jgi:hypothetical protein